MGLKQYPETVQQTLAIASKKGIPCKVIPHEQDGKTSQNAAISVGVDVEAVVKCLILETDKGFAVAIIAGDKRLDIKAVANQLDCKKVRLASPKSAAEFSGYEVGGIPPIVFQGRCPVVVDDSLARRKFCIGSAGTPNHGLLFPVKFFSALNYQYSRISLK